MLFFFFKQKTAYEMRISDWSSDVCSSDLSAPKENSAIKRAFRSSARWISSPSSTIWAAGLIVAQAAAWASSSRWRKFAPASKRLNQRRDTIPNEIGTGVLSFALLSAAFAHAAQAPVAQLDRALPSEGCTPPSRQGFYIIVSVACKDRRKA